MTSRICATPGCGLIIPANQHRCARHTSAHTKAHNDRPIMAIYRDPRWRLTRATVLERDGHTCQLCGAPATIADHHPTPVLKCPDPFDPDACRALCTRCSGHADGRRATRKGGESGNRGGAHNPAQAHGEKKRVGAGSAWFASDRTGSGES